MEIASQVSHGEKEVNGPQIWFQNRRQVFRRRSRPVMSPMQFSSSFSMEPSSSQVTKTPASTVPKTQAIDRRMPRRPRKRQTSTRWRSDRQTNPLDAVKSTQPVRKPNYQGSKSEEAQTTTDRRPKTKEKKKAMTELDTELDGNESDKENWVPGTQTMVVACPSPDASP
ncbi:hypothetical protein Q9189_004891 [Teloschistes chrysophthalmus]